MSSGRRSALGRAGIMTLVVVVGCAPAASAAGEPFGYTPNRLDPDVRQASARAAVAQVLPGLPGVAATVLREVPGEPVRVRVSVPAAGLGDGAEYPAVWRANIVIGAVGDLVGVAPTARGNASGVGAFSLPGGGVFVDDHLTGGDVAARQAFTDEPLGQIRVRVTSAASACGLDVQSVAAVRGISVAPEIVLRARSGSQLTTCRDLLARLFGPSDQQLYEGYYLQVNRPDGTPAIRIMAAFRRGTGGSWGTSEAVGQLGIIRSGPPVARGISPFVVGFGGVRAVSRRGNANYIVRLRLPKGARVTAKLRVGRTTIAGQTLTATRSRWTAFALSGKGRRPSSGAAPVLIDVRGTDGSGRRLQGSIQLTMDP